MKKFRKVSTRLRFNPFLAATLLFTLFFSGLKANEERVIVYDNIFNTSGEYFSMETEFGDEVILAGSARIFRSFELEYFAEFTQDNDHKVIVRFYLNDGPEVAPGAKAPGTLLLQTEAYNLAPGRNTISFEASDLSFDQDLILPNVFTWTIETQGFDNTNDSFGILLSDPVYIGNSFRDFWNVEAENGEFGPRIFSDRRTAANFSQRIYASGGKAGEPNDQIEEKPFVFQIIDFDQESSNWSFLVDGTENTRFSLEFSPDLNDWVPIISLRTQKEPTPLTLKQPIEGQSIFFRTLYSDPQLEDFIVDRTNITAGEVDLKVLGDVGLNIRIEWTSDFSEWRPLVKLTVGNQKASYLHKLPNGIENAFYRVIVLP